MHCPKCGILIHLDKESKATDTFFNKSKWGYVPEGFFQCKGCGLARPDVWWDTLQLDINTEIKFEEEKEVVPVPPLPYDIEDSEDFGYCESPWSD